MNLRPHIQSGSIILLFFFLFLTTAFLLPAEKKTKTDLRTGLFLSLGPMNYTRNHFSENLSQVTIKEPSDLYLGISLIIRNLLELNLVYNRTTENAFADPELPVFDKDGFGLEAGLNIPIHLFRKNDFDVYLEFSGGGYGMFYPFIRQSGGIDAQAYAELTGNAQTADDSTHYQLGFYWAIRMRYLISGKASIEIGYKSLLPAKSNEFDSRGGQGLIYNKSFLTIGISF